MIKQEMSKYNEVTVTQLVFTASVAWVQRCSGWERKLRTTVAIHYNPETLRPPPALPAAPVEHEATTDCSDHVAVESEHSTSPPPQPPPDVKTATGQDWRLFVSFTRSVTVGCQPSEISSVLPVSARLGRSIREYRTDTIVFTIVFTMGTSRLRLFRYFTILIRKQQPAINTQSWLDSVLEISTLWVEICIRIGIMWKRSIRYCDIIVYHQCRTNERLFELRGLFTIINLIELHYS